MDADKGFLEGDMPELRSERFVITKGEGEGRGWQRDIHVEGTASLSPVAEGPCHSKGTVSSPSG